MRVPAAFVALPLIVGASAGVVLSASVPDRLILLCAFASVLCTLAGAGFFADDFDVAVALCVCLGCLFAGYSLAGTATRSLVHPPLLDWFEFRGREGVEPVVLEGRLREDAAQFDYGAALTVDVESAADIGAAAVPAAGGVRLIAAGTPDRERVTEWRAGRRVRVTARLRYPASFSDPGVPDERWQLALRGVVLAGTVKSASLVERVGWGTWLDECAASARAWTRRVIARHVGRLDARSAAVATAILIGDRTGLSEEDERRLQQAGTYHVIAISGGNIAILTTLLVFGARVGRVSYRGAAVASILILLFYGEVAGGAASVSRAVTAAVVFLVSLALDHRGSTLNVLAVAAAIAIGVRPATTLDGGFLLSFGATAGIILGVPLLVRWKPAPGKCAFARAVSETRRAVTGIAAATLCAEIVLLPVSASLFSRVTAAGLVLNFAAIPLMTAVQCGSMALLAIAPAWTASADALGHGVHWSAWALIESSSLVEFFPWASRDVPPPALWVSALYYLTCTAVVFCPPYRRASVAALIAVGTVIVSGAGPAQGRVAPAPAGVLRVVVMDVGQGDATLAILPGGAALLIDAGGLAGATFDMAARVILPAMRGLGVRDLHAFVITHGDPDHVGGAAGLVRRVDVANVWEGVPVPPNALLRELKELTHMRHVVWRTVRPGDVERSGEVEVRVHHPPEPDWERQRVRNDDSVVLELRYRNVSILLPGDIGGEGEHAVLSRVSLAPLVVLKAAHHGSATSSTEEFLDATRPKAVIFSTGRNNRFGHPAPLVLERFRRRGVDMFNTAEDGAVFVETDGDRLEVRAWKTNKTLVAYAKHDDATTR